jgi:hypothetical protein
LVGAVKQRTYDHYLGQIRDVVKRMLEPGHGAELVALAAMPTVGPDGFPRSSTVESDVRHAGAGDPTGEVAARASDVERFPGAARDARYVGDDDSRVASTDDDEPTGRPFDVDLAAKQLQELFAALAEARGLMLRVAALDTALSRRRRQAERPAAGGSCLCCGRYVSGGVKDRLRGGLCSTDATAWYRYRSAASERGEFADSAVFLAQRRRQLGLAERSDA